MSVKTTVPVLIQLCCHNVYRIVAKSIIVFTTVSKKLFEFFKFFVMQITNFMNLYIFSTKNIFLTNQTCSIMIL